MRGVVALTAALALAVLTGCAQPSPSASAPSASQSHDPQVVRPDGVRGARLGMTRRELVPRLDRGEGGCSARLAGLPQASLVFSDDDRLVLVWFDSPLHTPEAVQTGMPLSKVTEAYPGAAGLSAPPGSHRFDGLLVIEGDRGYLFLHDGQTVRKAIAGYTDFLHRLFDTGFGSC